MKSTINKIKQLQEASGSKQKVEILKANKEDMLFTSLLQYILNPFLTYKVSENTLRQEILFDSNGTPEGMDMEHIFSICDVLCTRKSIDNATLRKVQRYLSAQDDETKEFYIKVLSKTLRLGVTAKTVNKVIPGLIPEWEVQQAYPIEKYPVKEGTEFWLTQKLNGVRATYYNGNLYARSGAIYTGLDYILSELNWANKTGLVLDGELTLRNKGALSDNEAFRKATGILNSDQEHKTEIQYTVFDGVSNGDFILKEEMVTYSHRRTLIDRLFQGKSFKYTKLLPVLYHGTDQSKIDELLNQMVAEDKEGLMLNLDVPYRRTRHRGILKIKRFYTMDLPIIKCEEGSGRLSGTLGALVVDFKGNEVSVGSGFTDEQRALYWNKRDELQSVLCEVKYKEVSTDKKTGQQSLQFPIFVSLRFDKDDVNYE